MDASVAASHGVGFGGCKLVARSGHVARGGRVVVLDVVAVRPAVVLIFKDAEWCLALSTVAVVLSIVGLEGWGANVGALLLHGVPCLGLPISPGWFVVGGVRR